MDKLLAKYADYSHIEQVADLNTSDEAGPSRSSEDTIAGAHLASTSTIPARRTPSSEGHHHFGGHLQPPDDQSRHEPNFPALFRLEQQSEHGAREWQYNSPEKVLAAKGDIDGTMLAEFAGLSSEAFNRSGSSSQGAANPGSHPQWVANLLVECARAIAVSDSARVKNLMWVLNELSSPYGDSDQRLAAYFLQALFCRITATGPSCHRILTAAAEKTYSFDTLFRVCVDLTSDRRQRPGRRSGMWRATQR